MNKRKKIEKPETCNCLFCMQGARAEESSGLLVKGFGRGKKVKAIAIQFITQGDVMRGRNQARNKGG